MENVLLTKAAVSAVFIPFAVIPSIGAWTDYKVGKIRNSLTFPLFGLSILAISTMRNAPDFGFGLSLAIALGFGYAFYHYDRWGAGDGKYYVVLGWLLLTLERGFSLGTWVLNRFTYASFAFFLIVVSIEFARKLKKNTVKIAKTPKWWHPSHFNVAAFVYLGGQFVGPHLPKESPFIAMTLLFLVAMSVAGRALSNKFAYVLPVLAVASSAYYGNRYGFALSVAFTVVFKWMEAATTPIFEAVDTKTVRLGEVRQGDIVASVSFPEILEKTGVRLRESPLQWDETYDLIESAKERGFTDMEIRVYESFKMGIALYAGYLFALWTLAWKLFPKG